MITRMGVVCMVMYIVTAILLILSLFFLLAACTVTSPDMSLSPSIPLPTKTTISDQPAPPQSLPFKSLEEAKAFILDPQSSTAGFMEYAELEDAHFTMIDKFKSEGYLPYVLVDGKEALGATGINLQPEVDMIDIGTSCGGNYNDKRYAIHVHFIKDEYAEQAQSGIREYMSARFSGWDLSNYKDTPILFNGKTANAIAFTWKEDGYMDFYWVFDDELYIKVRYWSIKEAEALEFIKHMSIEKFPLTA